MSTTSIVDRPTFRGITKDMLTKIFTDKRLVKMVHPLSVTLNRADCDNSARMLMEIDYTLVLCIEPLLTNIFYTMIPPLKI